VPAKPPSLASSNPIVARQLHAAGLTALNQGAVDRAVNLLRRAAALDPGNAVMARDVARAERIATTVKARR
jgi:Flp pilus assembly protein TadD